MTSLVLFARGDTCLLDAGYGTGRTDAERDASLRRAVARVGIARVMHRLLLVSLQSEIGGRDLDALVGRTPLSFRTFGFSMASPSADRLAAVFAAAMVYGCDRVLDRIKYISGRTGNPLHVIAWDDALQAISYLRPHLSSQVVKNRSQQ